MACTNERVRCCVALDRNWWGFNKRFNWWLLPINCHGCRELTQTVKNNRYELIYLRNYVASVLSLADQFARSWRLGWVGGGSHRGWGGVDERYCPWCYTGTDINLYDVNGLFMGFGISTSPYRPPPPPYHCWITLQPLSLVE